MIRNYLGFPSGVGGAELASRAAEQAWLLGATFLFMRRVTGLRRQGNRIVVNLSCGQDVTAKAVIIATGASYRHLGVPASKPCAARACSTARRSRKRGP